MPSERKITLVFFSVYLAMLVWIIVFKLQFSLNLLPDIRGINLIPFYEAIIKNGSVYIFDKIYNTIFFVPYGVYLALLWPNWSFIQKVKPIFLTSLTFELVQYVFQIGATDISDLILNTFGGVVGFGIFYVIQKIFKDKSYIFVNALALVVIILLTVLRFRLKLRL